MVSENKMIHKYILDKLNEMRLNNNLCDLELIADDGVGVLVHSPVWIAAFEKTAGMEQTRTVYSVMPKPKQLDIHGISGMTLESVVEFIYGGTVGIDFTEDVQIALEKLGLTNWADFCGVEYKMYKGKYCDIENSNQKLEVKCDTDSGIDVDHTNHPTDTSKIKKEIGDTAFDCSGVTLGLQLNDQQCSFYEENGMVDSNYIKQEPMSPPACENTPTATFFSDQYNIHSSELNSPMFEKDVTDSGNFNAETPKHHGCVESESYNDSGKERRGRRKIQMNRVNYKSKKLKTLLSKTTENKNVPCMNIDIMTEHPDITPINLEIGGSWDHQKDENTKILSSETESCDYDKKQESGQNIFKSPSAPCSLNFCLSDTKLQNLRTLTSNAVKSLKNDGGIKICPTTSSNINLPVVSTSGQVCSRPVEANGQGEVLKIFKPSKKVDVTESNNVKATQPVVSMSPQLPLAYGNVVVNNSPIQVIGGNSSLMNNSQGIGQPVLGCQLVTNVQGIGSVYGNTFGNGNFIVVNGSQNNHQGIHLSSQSAPVLNPSSTSVASSTITDCLSGPPPLMSLFSGSVMQTGVQTSYTHQLQSGVLMNAASSLNVATGSNSSMAVSNTKAENMTCVNNSVLSNAAGSISSSPSAKTTSTSVYNVSTSETLHLPTWTQKQSQINYVLCPVANSASESSGLCSVLSGPLPVQSAAGLGEANDGHFKDTLSADSVDNASYLPTGAQKQTLTFKTVTDSYLAQKVNIDLNSKLEHLNLPTKPKINRIQMKRVKNKNCPVSSTSSTSDALAWNQNEICHNDVQDLSLQSTVQTSELEDESKTLSADGDQSIKITSVYSCRNNTEFEKSMMSDSDHEVDSVSLPRRRGRPPKNVCEKVSSVLEEVAAVKEQYVGPTCFGSDGKKKPIPGKDQVMSLLGFSDASDDLAEKNEMTKNFFKWKLKGTGVRGRRNSVLTRQKALSNKQRQSIISVMATKFRPIAPKSDF